MIGDTTREYRPERLAQDFVLDAPKAPANDYRAVIAANVRWTEQPPRLISVVVPVWDQSLTPQFLSAIENQTYGASFIELLLVEHGPSPATGTLLEAVRVRFHSVQVVDASASSASLAGLVNHGIAAASSEHVVVIDPEEPPDVELVALCLQRLEADIPVVCIGQSTQNAGSTPLARDPHPFQRLGSWTIAMSSGTFDMVGGFDVDLGPEDSLIEWGYRAWNRGRYVVPIETAEAQPASADTRTAETVSPELLARCPVLRQAPHVAVSPDLPPLVSIYIPAHNARDTIVAAISSALNQTVEDLEVCVVDDGSTDDTASVIASAFGGDERVRLHQQDNGGIGAASNRAVRMCRAPFIGQLDADDELHPDAVEQLLTPLRADPSIGVVYSSSERMDEHGNPAGDSYEFPEFSRYQMMYLMIVHHFRLFRARDWYRTAGFATDISNAVDYDMFLKMSEVTEILHIPEQLYRYRKHAGSTSQATHSRQRANHRLAVQRALDRRGLSSKWELTPRQPIDPRQYEFTQRKDGGTSFGRGIDSVRLSLSVGWQQGAATATLQELFPTWDITQRRRLGEPRVESPPLSHARALRLIDAIAEHFPREAIRLVYA